MIWAHWLDWVCIQAFTTICVKSEKTAWEWTCFICIYRQHPQLKLVNKFGSLNSIKPSFDCIYLHWPPLQAAYISGHEFIQRSSGGSNAVRAHMDSINDRIVKLKVSSVVWGLTLHSLIAMVFSDSKIIRFKPIQSEVLLKTSAINLDHFTSSWNTSLHHTCLYIATASDGQGLYVRLFRVQH